MAIALPENGDMKKIGVITLIDYNNYGNRLQSFATQEVLKSLGFYAESITYKPRVIMNKSDSSKAKIIGDKVKKILKMSFMEILQRTIKKAQYHIFKNDRAKRNAKRINQFKLFTKQYILETDYSISDDDISDYLSERYDYFIAGSDQIWNPYFNHGSSLFFLLFAPREKRIAYAPSFGISAIPDGYLDSYKAWISGMESLSVREESGAKIIKSMTGRDATVLIDPTLMLTKEQWLSISKQAVNKPKGKYLLTLFLGKASSIDLRNAKRIASANDLKIVALANIKDLKTYMADPSEFIDYISSAEIILTDSFHGSIFSILFEKPFIVLDRRDFTFSMYSRVSTLLTTFGLESRTWENMKTAEDIFSIDYSHVASILKSERIKALDYLKQALGGRKPENHD